MNILVTGGCGFVGTNLSIFLKKKGFNVSTLDNFVRKGSRFNYITLKKLKIKNYNLDISNYSNIKKLPKFDFYLIVVQKQLLKFLKMKLIELSIQI